MDNYRRIPVLIDEKNVSSVWIDTAFDYGDRLIGCSKDNFYIP